MIILSIDASLNCPGFAVISVENRKSTLIMTTVVDNSGENKKKAADRKSTATKIAEISACFHRLIKQYKPDVIVRERGFSHHANVTQLLFRVIGALDLVAMNNCGKDIEEIPPKEVKLTMTGCGTADKTLVATSLLYYVGERPYVKDDESDAVAVGLTYAIKNDLLDSKLEVKVRKKPGRPKKGAHKRMVMPHENMRDRRIRSYLIKTSNKRSNSNDKADRQLRSRGGRTLLHNRHSC